MLKRLSAITLGCAILASPYTASARDEIRIVGSSTVYPFVTVIAEHFGKKYSNFPTPIVEATGTGGGFKLFCQGNGDDAPDISNASRPIKQSEIDLCHQNGVYNIRELKIGYDGIVIANLTSENALTITPAQLFLALAKEIPSDDGKLIANPNTRWNQIDASLPDKTITVYGPPPTSGTRDAFVELVMEPSCLDIPAFETTYPDKEERKKMCHVIREDGVFIEAGENDNLIVQKLEGNNDAFGIFGYSFLEMNASKLHGAIISGVTPTFENIASGSYPISRPLFVYFNVAHLTTVKGLKELITELTSDAAIGEDGYIIEKGLIPLTAEDLARTQKIAQ